ncbi:MAG: hypothetical protein K0R98_2065 [Rickettsiaceae bacterium]|jgi:plasmid stabilization system protein ParE|nr:hypothetical protein [Rickettsiaceae bacterium]
MAKRFLLSKAAKEDLKSIARYTEQNWEASNGIFTSIKYLNALIT